MIASASRPRVLFIARAYPPTVGGMENFARELREHLASYAHVTDVINRRGKKALPLFLPFAAAAAVERAGRREIDAVHLADALLAPIGALIRRITGLPVTASVCGLDVTYGNPAYQAIVPRALCQLDMVMPISAATERAMRERTGSSPPSTVIPLGVNLLPDGGAAAERTLARAAGPLEGARVVLTVGRLIERKGVAWFVREVFPRLDGDVIYVVVGEGPQQQSILRAAAAAGVSRRVRLIGRVSDAVLAAAYRRADVFVMPNVPVLGDVEGFGLVALEAAASGTPVIASDLEGIADAIRPDRNGILCPPGDAAAFKRAVSGLLDSTAAERRSLGARFEAYTLQNYGWDANARRHAEAIHAVIRSTSARVAAYAVRACVNRAFARPPRTRRRGRTMRTAFRSVRVARGEAPRRASPA